MDIQYKVETHPYGKECYWSCVREGKENISESFIIMDSQNVEDFIQSEIARIDSEKAQDSITESQEKPSILTFLESEKEELKYELIAYMRTNPTAILS